MTVLMNATTQNRSWYDCGDGDDCDSAPQSANAAFHDSSTGETAEASPQDVAVECLRRSVLAFERPGDASCREKQVSRVEFGLGVSQAIYLTGREYV
jgi:hypothetical protein